jgi:hypothetical protein
LRQAGCVNNPSGAKTPRNNEARQGRAAQCPVNPGKTIYGKISFPREQTGSQAEIEFPLMAELYRVCG